MASYGLWWCKFLEINHRPDRGNLFCPTARINISLERRQFRGVDSANLLEDHDDGGDDEYLVKLFAPLPISFVFGYVGLWCIFWCGLCTI